MSNENFETVKVCNGAGCKAWASRELLNKLSNLENEMGGDSKRVKAVPCMNKCGGGISVKSKSCKSILKFREAKTALSVLVPEIMVESEEICA